MDTYNSNNAFPLPTLDIAYFYHKLKKFLLGTNRSLLCSMEIQGTLHDFLVIRSTAAADEYYSAVEAGASLAGANEISNAILFLNINFDAKELLEEYLIEHFPAYYRAMKKDDQVFTWLDVLESECKWTFEKLARTPSDVFEDPTRNHPLIIKMAEVLAINKTTIIY